MSIPLPPLHEQKAIAKALRDVDELIEGLDKLIAKKRDIKQATMQQPLTGKRRLPGFSGEWSQSPLGESLVRILGGGTPSRSVPAYWGKEIPWITVKDFATFNPTSAQEYITKQGLLHSSTNLVPKGTVIISTRMGLGKAVVYAVDIAINQDLKALFPCRELSSDFLRYWLESNAQTIEAMGTGSTVKGVALSDIKKYALTKATT